MALVPEAGWVRHQIGELRAGAKQRPASDTESRSACRSQTEASITAGLSLPPSRNKPYGRNWLREAPTVYDIHSISMNMYETKRKHCRSKAACRSQVEADITGMPLPGVELEWVLVSRHHVMNEGQGTESKSACRSQIEANITGVARGQRTKEEVLVEAAAAFSGFFRAARQQSGTAPPTILALYSLQGCLGFRVSPAADLSLCGCLTAAPERDCKGLGFRCPGR